MTSLITGLKTGLSPEQIVAAYEKVLFVLHDYYGDHYWFLLFTAISVLFLSLEYPKLRKSLFLPIFLIFCVIIQPYLYAKIFYRIIYWRLFWMVPDALLIACAVTRLTQKLSKNWQKLLLLAASCMLIAWAGKSNFADGRYIRTQNPYKLDQNVIDICDSMLALDSTPHVIALDKQFCQIRQYNGDITLAYGRNAVGYIMFITDNQQNAYNYLHKQGEADFENLLPLAVEDGYDFIISYTIRPISETLLAKYKFQPIALIDNYIVYYSSSVHQSRKIQPVVQ